MTYSPIARATLIVSLLLPIVVSCGLAQAVRPDAPTAVQATGEKCDASAESTNSYVVDLSPDKRSDLELALDSGDLAVVSFSCDELKILKTCKAAGKYEYKGTSAKERVLSLENGDQIRAALPLGGAGIAATFEAEASTGTKFDLGLVIGGQRVGSAASFSAAELTGNCTGATHVITAGKLGAFAMGTSAKSELKTAAEVFGAGVSAGSKSSRLAKERDGSIEACGASATGDTAPPKQCDALLAIELTKLSKGFGTVEVDIAFGITYGEEACTDVPNCESACNSGKGKGCRELAIVLIQGAQDVDKNIPRGLQLLNKGCELGDIRSCSALSSMLVFEERYDEALPLAEKACNVGDDKDGCLNLGIVLERTEHKDRAVKPYTKACVAGIEIACTKAKAMENP